MFTFCSLSGWNAREGSPGHTLVIESSHGSEKVQALLASTGWENGKIAIAFVRSYSCMICRALLPILLWEQELDWDPESGIGLAG